MGYLSKRTDEQVEYSQTVLKDFTGGYNFIAWLIWMRKWFPYLLLPACLFFAYLGWYWGSNIAIGISLGLLCFYVIALKISYNRLKKGISA